MRKRLEGKVVSDKQQKTRIVVVERLVQHPLYKKYLKRQTRLQCHDPKEQFKVGDKVVIEETRPLSRTKHWRIVKPV
ncbi:MAG: 30S ribosomal protein S17 [Candidatus Stahlbacteria bacterium]|nr:30S ribosomal protein S17 [Candidatus Stahlbacteria bacterium]